MADKINLCLVDDHRLFRKAMTRLLATFPRVGNITEAENGKQCLDLLARTRDIHMLLLDIEMPVMNGLETAELALQKFPDLKIIVLTMHDSEPYMEHLLDLGVHSFLFKSADPAELERAIHAVADNGFFHTAPVQAMLRKIAINRPRRESILGQHELTDREREILILICNDVPVKEIAERLSISEKTVHSHKSAIRAKLNLRSTIAMVHWAYQMGLVNGF